MKRVAYSIPVFFLLLPWAFISMVIVGVGLTSSPASLLLLLPMGAVLASAFYIHRQQSKRGRHFVAATGASLVLSAPLFLIVVAFFTCGDQVLCGPNQPANVNTSLTAWQC